MTLFSFKFAVFFTVVLGAFWASRSVRPLRQAVLIAASYFFYANFNPWFLILLFGVSMTDYGIGRGIGAASSPGRRKLLLIASIALNLGLLAAFKYLNFLINIPNDVFELLGKFPQRSELRLPMAVGISFYVFQTLSYVIDVYRGKIQPTKSVSDHLLYISFFPRILAGPIVRAGEFVPQLADVPFLSPEKRGLALFFLVSGFVKKLAVADYLSVNFVDRVFDLPLMYSTTEILTAIYAYTIQIYCDFSGYTDIALGLSLLLGIQLPENFQFPYQSINLQDFWRRWHMTLSFWLRDYLYISMGGSRNDKSWKTYRNLIITFVLGGLWHGAAWTFVIWGFLHGLGLAVTHYWQNLRKRLGRRPSGNLLLRGVFVFLTFNYVALAWVFFRANSVQTVRDMFSQLKSATWGASNLSMTVVYVMIAAAAGMWFPQKAYEAIRKTFIRLPYIAQAALVLCVFYLIFKVAASDVAPFVYQQF